MKNRFHELVVRERELEAQLRIATFAQKQVILMQLKALLVEMESL